MSKVRQAIRPHHGRPTMPPGTTRPGRPPAPAGRRRPLPGPYAGGLAWAVLAVAAWLWSGGPHALLAGTPATGDVAAVGRPATHLPRARHPLSAGPAAGPDTLVIDGIAPPPGALGAGAAPGRPLRPRGGGRAAGSGPLTGAPGPAADVARRRSTRAGRARPASAVAEGVVRQPGTPAPGEAGVAVVVAPARGGSKPFLNLGRLRPGARVRIGRHTGRAAVFVVEDVSVYRHADYDPARVAAPRHPGRAELRLVGTGADCGSGRDDAPCDVMVSAYLTAA